MKNIKSQSLGELENLYKRQIQHWVNKQREHEKAIEECRQQVQASEANLRHVQALLGASSENKVARVVPKQRRTRRKRRRRSPVREALLLALRNRPGQRLTTKQLLTAIRQDTGKRVSRQSVNVNLGRLEKEGLVRRDPAPRGLGARFVFSAV